MFMNIPQYNEIPDVGLYLDQVTKYLNTYLSGSMTPTMVTNYVKLKIVPKAVKKAYSRDQIAMFFFIALSKQLLSMDQIRTIFSKYQNIEEFYTTFKNCLEGKKCKDPIINKIGLIILQKNELDRDIEKILG